MTGVCVNDKELEEHGKRHFTGFLKQTWKMWEGRETEKIKPELTLLLKTRHSKQHYASVLQFHPVLFPFVPIWVKTMFQSDSVFSF